LLHRQGNETHCPGTKPLKHRTTEPSLVHQVEQSGTD
jgi:hypothetical protein